MKRLIALLCLTGVCQPGFAQNLVIANARIIDGAGLMIESGSIVIRDGRIDAIVSGPAAITGLTRIDAEGMTALPAFIDAHRHIIRGDVESWFANEAEQRMQEFFDAGYTTLMSGGDPAPAIVELQRLIDSGALIGPRIVSAGVVRANGITPEQGREGVRELADAGVDIVKSFINLTDTGEERATLAAITAEADRHGLDTMVHAVTVPAMLAAVAAGADKLVHTPHDSFMTPEEARVVAEAGIENLSTIGFAVPLFGVFNDDNIPTFRDGSPWPEGILGTGSNAAGEKAVNARTLWDAGVTFGFGTDTNYLPSLGLQHELKALNLMFSPADILKLMGPNTAAFIEM
ncbi:MAG TPA: amidohydrolase family protein, partial [Gammaproteobacteria bacterium]|nr:amidohydrolase family protein [Gammaproteobacteria bacterium]